VYYPYKFDLFVWSWLASWSILQTYSSLLYLFHFVVSLRSCCCAFWLVLFSSSLYSTLLSYGCICFLVEISFPSCLHFQIVDDSGCGFDCGCKQRTYWGNRNAWATHGKEGNLCWVGRCCCWRRKGRVYKISIKENDSWRLHEQIFWVFEDKVLEDMSGMSVIGKRNANESRGNDRSLSYVEYNTTKHYQTFP